MTITLTPISKGQWKKVGVVAVWIILTNGIGILVAWLTKQPSLLAIGPALNVLGKAVQSVFETEEQAAITSLPANAQPEAQQVADAAAAAVGTIITPTEPQTPVTAAPAPPIGAAPGS
jgi:hypothetical protein